MDIDNRLGDLERLNVKVTRLAKMIENEIDVLSTKLVELRARKREIIEEWARLNPPGGGLDKGERQ